eukprot:TRINITY_DN26913_c0_g1_i5.p1 TRINITY_DN26913_c0_g1~~TRINITY_DN26913_c0_g1_i5.p1  ORF type:complete len:369 (+),score=64.46 TRINITY_DN26913_c0_g1_i5:148-1107(+)
MATFAFKAVNAAQRGREGKQFKHLIPYARLLNDAARHFVQERPFKGTTYRVLPVSSAFMLDKYDQLARYYAKGTVDTMSLFSWSGFTSASKDKDLIFRNMRIYGMGASSLILFVISPDESRGSYVYPIDLGDLAAFGKEEKELLYTCGQQFRVVDFKRMTRLELASHLNLQYDEAADGGSPITLIELKAVDVFYEYASDFFKDDGKPQEALAVLRSKLKEEQHCGNRLGEATCLTCMGNACAKMGKLDTAAHYCQKGLAIREAMLDKNHPDLASSFNNLGSLLRERGDLDKAAHYFQKSLAIREAVLDKKPSRSSNFLQ